MMLSVLRSLAAISFVHLASEAPVAHLPDVSRDHSSDRQVGGAPLTPSQGALMDQQPPYRCAASEPVNDNGTLYGIN